MRPMDIAAPARAPPIRYQSQIILIILNWWWDRGEVMIVLWGKGNL